MCTARVYLCKVFLRVRVCVLRARLCVCVCLSVCLFCTVLLHYTIMYCIVLYCMYVDGCMHVCMSWLPELPVYSAFVCVVPGRSGMPPMAHSNCDRSASGWRLNNKGGQNNNINSNDDNNSSNNNNSNEFINNDSLSSASLLWPTQHRVACSLLPPWPRYDSAHICRLDHYRDFVGASQSHSPHNACGLPYKHQQPTPPFIASGVSQGP